MFVRRMLIVVAVLLSTVAMALGTLPSRAEGPSVIRVTDFGADPAGSRDSALAVKAAIAHAKTLSGPIRIEFPRGTYQLYPDQAEQRELYLSNTIGSNSAYKTKSIAILLEDMSDVTIDGGGSKFVMHGQQTIFAALRSANTTIRNFSLDWVSPRAVDLTVVGVGDGYRDLKLPLGYQYQISGTTLRISSENSPYTGQPYWTYSNLMSLPAQILDLDSGRNWRLASFAGGLTGFSGIAEISPGILRMRVSSGDQSGLGRVFQVRQWDRDTAGMLSFESKQTTIEDIQLGYLHGFGILAQLSDGITVRGVDFRALASSWRQTAGFADLIQVSTVKGEVNIENNRFGYAQDDPINVHGTYLQLKSTSGSTATVTYQHHETAGFPQYYPGDQVGLVDRATMLEVPDWKATVLSVQGPSGYDQNLPLTEMSITLDKPLPEGVTGSQYVVENLTYQPNLNVRGNRFETIPTRGLLVSTRGKVMIEDNVFDQQNMASIYVSGDANTWYESSAVRDLTIRNNVFIRPSSDHPVLLFEPITQQPSSDRKVHSGIVIDSNTFLIGNTPVLDAKSVDGLRFTNNRVLRYDNALALDITPVKSQLVVGESISTRLGGQLAYTDPLVVLRNAANVTLGGNSYDDGLNRRINLVDGTQASTVALAGDALTVNGDSTAPQGMLGYVSSDPSVVQVDNAGRIFALAAGTAQVSAWRRTPFGLSQSRPLPLTVAAGTPAPSWKLNPALTVIRPVEGSTSIADDQSLRLLPAGGTLWTGSNNAANIHALTEPRLAVGQNVTVKMSGRTKAWYEEAGLLLYSDDDNYVAIQRKHNNGARSLTVVTERGGLADESRRIADPQSESLWLRLTRTGASSVQAAWSSDGSKFTDLGSAVPNTGVTDTSRVTVLAAGSNLPMAEMPRFEFSGLAVGSDPIPFAVQDQSTPGPASPPKPDAPSSTAQLESASFSGANLPGAAAELASQSGFVRMIPASVSQYSVKFTPLDSGARVQVRLDGRVIDATNGYFQVPITGGANVLEATVTAANGVSQRIYRWVTLSDRFVVVPEPSPSATATATMTVQATVTVTVTVTPTVTVKPTTVKPSAPATTGPVDVYSTPGFHFVNGRSWYTSCESYSRTYRCTTQIWATQIKQVDGRFVSMTGWAFNNLTYLPYMTKAQWGKNPLANAGTWTAGGRRWKTECGSECRSYIWTAFIASAKNANGTYRHFWTSDWVFNNIVRFKSA